MRRFVDAGPWAIAVDCDLPSIHDGLAANFGGRYRTQARAGARLLTCEVVNNPEKYGAAVDGAVLNGPHIKVSEGVTIQYGLHPPKTWLSVTNTAMIELDARTPEVCRVLLHPDVASSQTRAERPAACAEAFFYPALVEWIRSFDACLVHCGAVGIGGRAVFLSGPPGSGKSTHVLRMLLRGVAFVADDLAFLVPQPTGLRLMPLREVANVNASTIETFPELASLKSSPLRDDQKYCVSIPECFPRTPIIDVAPGVVLRLHPGAEPTLEPVPRDRVLDGLHAMAWFGSRPDANQRHFWLLNDWLIESTQWSVSQGYMKNHLDELLERLGNDLGRSM